MVDKETKNIELESVRLSNLGPKLRSPIDRFLEKVKKTQFCWEWKSAKTKAGYGVLTINRKVIYAHRFSYTLFNGEIPEGLSLDHICRNRGCVNPGHLEAVTHAENMARSIPATKTHCKRGHLLEGDNLKITRSGQRWCWECHYIRKPLKNAI